MSTYIVRTTLLQVDGGIEKAIAQAEADDFDDASDAADEFLERIDEEEGDISEYLLCPVAELETVDVEEEGDDGDAT